MPKSEKILIGFAIVALALLAGYYYMFMAGKTPAQEKAPLVGADRDSHGCIGSAGYSWCEAKAICIRVWEEYCSAAAANKVVFNCDGGKSISATFYPTDDKFVDLVLSDGARLSLPRAISASGARYAREDESFVFWNKGDTAFITQGAETTYANCVLAGE